MSVDSKRSHCTVRGRMVLATLVLLYAPKIGAQQPAAPSQPYPGPAASTGASAELDELKRQLAEMNAKLKEQSEDLQQRVTQLESDDESRRTTDALQLRLYGFASAVLSRNWVKEASYWDGGYLVDRWSFGVSDFNLFMDSHAGERWRFLGEVRFLSQPNGYQTVQGTDFVRTDTSYLEPYYGATLRWSGILIERAQIEYKLSDQFGLLAGRFLTPYGIWNVEHGAPALIPVRMPFPVVNQVVPRAQTGLQMFGRLFPRAGFQVDYAVTVSNGRGPMDELADLDDNKAVGLRLRLAWERARTRVAIGTYLYDGDYTRRDKRISMTDGVLTAPSELTLQYNEKTAAFDLLIEHGPVRLQGEFMRRARTYTDGARESNMLRTGTYPDHVQQSAYALAAVRLPVPRVDVRAFGMFEWDTPQEITVKIYTGGLNWRITPAVVAKAEVYRVVMHTTIQAYSSWTGVATQLALSF